MRKPHKGYILFIILFTFLFWANVRVSYGKSKISPQLAQIITANDIHEVFPIFAAGGCIGLFTIYNRPKYALIVPEMKFYTGVAECPDFVVIPELKLPIVKRYYVEMSVESYQQAAFRMLFKNGRGVYYGTEKLLVDLLDIKPNHVVADVGAGNGYYVFIFADKAKKVIATDLSPSSGLYIKWVAQLSANGFFGKPKVYKNIETRVNDIDDVNLGTPVDRIFMHNVHYFIVPAEDKISRKFTLSLLKWLKKGGKILIVEHIPPSPRLRSPDEAVEYFKSFGLTVERKIVQKQKNRYILLLRK